jgi:hypothetical protein
MEKIRQKIAEIITHTHKTPLEQADEILLLFSVSGRSEQFSCGKERVFGENKCDKQCDDCFKEYGSN